MRSNKSNVSLALPSKKMQLCRKGAVLSLAAMLGGLAAVPTAHALNVIALTQGTNILLSFDSATPATLTGTVAVTGLQPGEMLRGIDFRPANGLLYGVGSTSRLYTIDSTTGAATQVGGPFTPALMGVFLGVDFNPVADRLRVVTNLDQNLRLNPDTGMVVDGDPVTAGIQADAPLAFSASDVNAGEDPFVAAVAYTNNFAGATTTTLFGIDFAQDFLARQGDPDGAPISPNTGQLFTVGTLNASTENLQIGFDIAVNGEALAALPIGATSSNGLHRIDIATGAATLIGPIGDGGTNTSGLTIVPAGQVDITPTAVTVAENGTSVILTVTRSGGSNGAVSVDFSTGDDTAVATSDYTTTAGTLTFAAGDTAPQTITVPIAEDKTLEGSENFTVNLSNATGGVAIGAGTAVVTITDTGGGGGGCVLSLDTPFDPALPVLLSLAGLYLMRRRLRG